MWRPAFQVLGLSSLGLPRESPDRLRLYRLVHYLRQVVPLPPSPATIDDEHDTKLAFTCVDQAEAFNSPAFDAAVEVYSSARQFPWKP